MSRIHERIRAALPAEDADAFAAWLERARDPAEQTLFVLRRHLALIAAAPRDGAEAWRPLFMRLEARLLSPELSPERRLCVEAFALHAIALAGTGEPTHLERAQTACEVLIAALDEREA